MKLNIKLNQYINSTYPLILLLLIYCDIVSTSVDTCNRRIIMIDKQHFTKGWKRDKLRKITETKLNIKVQSIYK